MSLFDKIFRPDKAKESEKALENARGLFKTLTAYKPVFTSWGGCIYESEIVRAAIDARARHISKLKIEVVGTANPSLQARLRLGMNQWQTNSQFLYRVSTILDINNTAFIVPVFDDRMIITGYYPVLPSRCEIIEYKGEPWLRYRFSSGEIGAVEFKKCAVLTKHQYSRDFFGDSNHALDETMKLIHIQNEGIEEAIKNTSTFRFMATLNNFTNSEDLQKETKRFREMNLSTEAEARGFLLFPSTYKDIKQIDVKPYNVDAAQIKQINENVYNYFAVNEDILQSKAYGDAWSAFYESVCETFAIQFSEAMTKAAFSERERAQGSYIIATSNRLQYLSNADKLAVSSQMADRGIMSRNEIRDIWNLPPIEGGDVPTIRGEYYLLNSDGSTTQDPAETITDEEQTND
ncbi:MAG: phage portal protein [Clostridia bacterium]|nr:phage portal protein [Clostridia bacterium]